MSVATSAQGVAQASPTPTLLRRVAIYPFAIVFPALGILAAYHKIEIALFGVYLLVALAALAVERLVPFMPSPPIDWPVNISYFVSNAILLFAIHQWVTPALRAVRDVVVSGQFWLTGLPLWTQVGLALVLVDLCHYCAHRISHGDNVFWRSHRIHHSPAGLYWLNGYRFHWLNELFFATARIIPMVLLGVPAVVVGCVTAIVQTMSLVPHLNADLRSGRLTNWIVNTPELHRWHHLQDPKLSACNFGATTVLWDHAFRTYQRPGVSREDLLGVPASERVSHSWAAQILSPWQRPATQTAGGTA
jgi:sterol desaturase/sphingolipid hydroxylase (fatty acid hydroxylase superfamily)